MAVAGAAIKSTDAIPAAAAKRKNRFPFIDRALRIGAPSVDRDTFEDGGSLPAGRSEANADHGVAAASASGRRSGWLLGYGTEFDLGKNWSAKAEYDYIDLGSRTALATDGVTTLRDSGAISQVKIGVNYRFSSQNAVVVKY